MEITIGIQNHPREIVLETDAPAADVIAAVEKALADSTPLSIADVKGRRVLVPAAALAYIEVGEENQRRVGFGSL